MRTIIRRELISRRRYCLFLACALLAAAAVAQDRAVLDRYSFSAGSLTQWRLPDKLNEISGLAFNADEQLFAVADEAAVVYELDVEKGRIRKTFAYGDPVLHGDFEGIAALGDRLYLLTSDGVIVSGVQGADGERLPFERYSTGLGRDCELEGLAQDEAGKRLLIACKNLRRKRRIDTLTIFTWSAGNRSLSPSEDIILPVGDILRRLRRDRLNPSGIVLDPASGHLILVASRQRALIELTRNGQLLRARALLAATRHRQPEGIEMTRDGKLLIADEGGSHKARLGIYRRDDAGEAPQR